MLVEFSISNFRSIKSEACLSLVAGQGREHRETHLMAPDLNKGVRFDPLVRAAVIYGANAAGKTNLLRGLEVMTAIVKRSHPDPEALHHITPFQFDPACRERETTFEVMCIVEGVRYQYGFAATSEAVCREWLYAWPFGRVQRWLERNGEDWVLGDKLQGDKELWKRATRDNALFLSTAVALNSEHLRPLFGWFANVVWVAGPAVLDLPFPLSFIYSQGERKGEIIEFLQWADLDIADIHIDERPFTSDSVPEDAPEEVKQRVQEGGSGKRINAFFRHDTPFAGHSVDLHLSDESAGTQKMFYLAGPFADALKTGQVVVMDEMNNSLHPALVKALVKQFHDPDRNTGGAQLVFSTHDTSILDQDTFRRDQIWFCERNRKLETQLYSLTEFRPRKGLENLERSYLAGRYGAIPYIRPDSYSSGL